MLHTKYQCSTDKNIFHLFPIEVFAKHVTAWWGHLWPQSFIWTNLGEVYMLTPIHVITITDNMDWGQHVSEISLGFLRRNLAFAPRSTKEVAYKNLVRPKLEYAAPIWSPHSKLLINQIEKVQRTAARWTWRRWRKTSSVGEMLDELWWPSLEARRDQSSLLFFHKIHCGAVSIEKDNYMTPAHSLKTTRSSHSAQYRRHQTYSNALKNPFSPELFHIGIVCLLLWPITSPQRSLGHSLFKQKFSQKFLCCFVFCVVFVFLFYQNYQIRTPWCNAQVWTKPETIERKKGRKVMLHTKHQDCNLSLVVSEKKIVSCFS